MHNNTNTNSNNNNNITVYFKNYPEFTHSFTLGSPQNAVSLKAWKKHTTKQSLLDILNQNVTD